MPSSFLGVVTINVIVVMLDPLLQCAIVLPGCGDCDAKSISSGHRRSGCCHWRHGDYAMSVVIDPTISLMPFSLQPFETCAVPTRVDDFVCLSFLLCIRLYAHAIALLIILGHADCLRYVIHVISFHESSCRSIMFRVALHDRGTNKHS